MGECGCGPDQIVRFPAPGSGRWYVLELHPGCRYCGAEWGLGVSVTSETDEEWGVWFGNGGLERAYHQRRRAAALARQSSSRASNSVSRD